MSFLPESLLVGRRPVPTLPLCGQCGLYRNGCKSPKMPVHGNGRRGILIVGEAPGRDEDERGKPFVGRTGQLLRRTLRGLGVGMDDDCWTTNALICRPSESNEIKNPKAIDYCRPNLLNTIKRLQPTTVILLGKVAVTSLIGWLWGKEIDEVGRWVGWRIPAQQMNAWVCPTWHPSFVMREESPALDKLWAGHLAGALECRGRPWRTVPDYPARVTVELNPGAAGRAVRGFTERNRPTAFDFETTSLKPDHADNDIVCCSLSDGKETIAFPWHGSVISDFKDFLVSEVPKVAANAKFEHRWCRAKLGVEVNHWHWDTMLAAHVLDHRGGVTGLKFQAFVQLGQPPYDRHVGPYLEAKGGGGNDVNRVREVGLSDLLRYCGMDSLLEAKLAKVQQRQMKL